MRLLAHGLVQLAAFVLAWVLVAPLAQPLGFAVLQGLLASMLATLWRLPPGARLMHALCVPLMVWLLSLGIHPAWYALGFVFLLALGRNAVTEKVPLYRSSREAVARLARLVPEGGAVLEAGCGDGRAAMWLSEARPDVAVTALESAWGSFVLAWLRWRMAGSPAGVRVACRSFWQEPLARYDVVYAFLSPHPMPRLWRKYVADGKPGSRLVSNTFEIPGVAPDEDVALGGPLQTRLLIWRHPDGTC